MSWWREAVVGFWVAAAIYFAVVAYVVLCVGVVRWLQEVGP